MIILWDASTRSCPKLRCSRQCCMSTGNPQRCRAHTRAGPVKTSCSAGTVWATMVPTVMTTWGRGCVLTRGCTLARVCVRACVSTFVFGKCCWFCIHCPQSHFLLLSIRHSSPPAKPTRQRPIFHSATNPPTYHPTTQPPAAGPASCGALGTAAKRMYD